MANCQVVRPQLPKLVTADREGADLLWRDQVVRHDMHLQKKGSILGGKLARVPFLITNVTTGEAHVAVTDRNGMLNTSSGLEEPPGDLERQRRAARRGLHRHSEFEKHTIRTSFFCGKQSLLLRGSFQVRAAEHR